MKMNPMYLAIFFLIFQAITASSPSLGPTKAPISSNSTSEFPFTCAFYSTSSTNSASHNYSTCSFTACGGTSLLVSDCGCTGDQYLRLFLGSVEVAYDDDSSCNLCSSLTYTVPGSSSNCSNYTIHEGCFSDHSCSGAVAVSTNSLSPTVSPSVVPTEIPTTLPTVVPSLTPTSEPTVVPSLVPTLYSNSGSQFQLSCPSFAASSTSSASKNYSSCSFSVCGGTSFTVSDCSCTGDLYLRLFEGSVEIAHNDDSCGLCSSLTYTVPGSSSVCSVYTVHEGCYNDYSCSGTVLVASTNTVSPTLSPSLLPSVAPSASPTVVPSLVPTLHSNSGSQFQLKCPSFTTSVSNSATQNYSICSFSVCGGTSFTVSDCSCTGDLYLRLFENSVEIAYNDDSCGLCSSLTYTVPGSSSVCSVYTVHEGCYKASNCSGTVLVASSNTLVPTLTPSVYPTVLPTIIPSVVPSLVPTLHSNSGTQFQLTCPAFTAGSTNSATQNYSSCSFNVCGGTSFTVSDCSCIGDMYLRLYEGSAEISFNDDSCGLCSSLTYTAPGSSSVCSIYTVHEGCYKATNCSGSVLIATTNTLSPTLAPSMVPTAYPTITPSVHPTVVPTAVPSEIPSLVPTLNSNSGSQFQLTCPPFAAASSNSATQNYSTCSFNVCGGTSFTVSDCSCTGDLYLRLFLGSVEVTYNDDSCGLCSSMTYTVPGSSSVCSVYTVREGCYKATNCSGIVVVGTTNTLSPTIAPSVYPTVVPTVIPTVVPSLVPTFHSNSGTQFQLTCPFFAATGTNSAAQNYSSCSFNVCGGTSITVSDCSCTGDMYLRLFEGSVEIAHNDDSCGTCSSLTYTVPGSSSVCSIYTIHEGCYSDYSCSGAVVVSSSYSLSPTPFPSVIPTVVPTVAPSVMPTVIPSLEPTRNDSLRGISMSPSQFPSPSPTVVLTQSVTAGSALDDVSSESTTTTESSNSSSTTIAIFAGLVGGLIVVVVGIALIVGYLCGRNYFSSSRVAPEKIERSKSPDFQSIVPINDAPLPLQEEIIRDPSPIPGSVQVSRSDSPVENGRLT